MYFSVCAVCLCVLVMCGIPLPGGDPLPRDVHRGIPHKRRQRTQHKHLSPSTYTHSQGVRPLPVLEGMGRTSWTELQNQGIDELWRLLTNEST